MSRVLDQRNAPAKQQIEDGEQVPAVERAKCVVQVRHRNKRIGRISPSVLRQDEALGPIVAIQGHAVTSEIEEDARSSGPTWAGSSTFRSAVRRASVASSSTIKQRSYPCLSRSSAPTDRASLLAVWSAGIPF